MAATIWTPGTLVSTVANPLTPIQFLKGTALLPGITFAGDVSTGVWSQAAGYINFTVNGVSVISIDPLGNLTTNANKWVSGVEVNVASAATVDLGTATSNLVQITGTNNITSFGTNYKGPIFVRFAGSLVLSSTSTLILPSGLSIQVSAGDSCVVVPKATAGVADGWQVISYTKASGGSVIAGADLSNTLRVDVASANVLDLTTVATSGTRNINITGTTAINSLIVPAGSLYFVRFAGVMTLTNSASLVTQSGANKVTAVGDSCIFRATAVNTIEILCYAAGTVVASPGTGGTTSTANVTLISTSAAALSVTPATPGLYVTLPDATTCTKADNNFSVYNAGDYDYGVKDSTGTKLGWIRPKTGAMIGLADNSTAAGVWAYYGLQKTGISALKTISVGAAISNISVAIDANRTMFFITVSATGLYAIVYDSSTNTWGSLTLVVSGTSMLYGAVFQTTNQVLVASAASGNTTLFAQVLSVSGTTITVNGGASTTSTLGVTGLELTAVGTTYVASYLKGSTDYGVRGITVSGVTPAFGAEVNPATTTAGFTPYAMAAGASFVLFSFTSGTGFNITPFSISGNTLTTGTPASVTFATYATLRYSLDGAGNIVFGYSNPGFYTGIAKLTGNTITVSTASADGNNTSSYPTDFLAVSSTKTFVLSTSNGGIYLNILTDTTGTISLGTALNINIGPGSAAGVVSVTSSTAVIAFTSTSSSGIITLDLTGSSPTITNYYQAAQGNYAPNGNYVDIFAPLNTSANGQRSAQKLIANNSVYAVTYGNLTLWNSNTVQRTLSPLIPALPNCPGQVASESFGAGALLSTGKSTIFKLEAAA